MNQTSKFRETLERYIGYRGIDIVLTLKDGRLLELDRNRKMLGENVVFFNSRMEETVHLSMIQKADFFVA